MKLPADLQAKLLAAAGDTGVIDLTRVSLGDAPPASEPQPEKPRGNKYRNTVIEFEGFTFDSKKELNRWLDLREEQRAARIHVLRRQVPFALAANGVEICDYVADFVYLRGDSQIVEDVKSKMTRKLPIYRIKKKLMLALLDIEIQEV